MAIWCNSAAFWSFINEQGFWMSLSVVRQKEFHRSEMSLLWEAPFIQTELSAWWPNGSQLVTATDLPLILHCFYIFGYFSFIYILAYKSQNTCNGQSETSAILRKDKIVSSQIGASQVYYQMYMYWCICLEIVAPFHGLCLVYSSKVHVLKP